MLSLSIRSKMERASESNKMPLKEACYYLLTIAIGFLSCSAMVVLAYLTYQTAAGNMNYCTLWTDIPGRLAIFITFYYVAGNCGSLPIPEQFRISFLPHPFILYKLDSWRYLFRNLCLLFPFTCQINEAFMNSRNYSEISNLRTGSDESLHEYSPNSKERSKDIPIANSDPSKIHLIRSNKDARNRNIETTHGSETSSMSFDSPIGGHIVPMAKGCSSKLPYFPDSSISTSELSDKSKSANASSGSLYELSKSLNDRAKAIAEENRETDTPPRTPDVELPLPNYPRFPWSFLKHKGDLSQEARVLHKRHLMAERRELDKYNKKQRKEETVQLPKEKDSEHEWITDSDDFSPAANRPLRLPPVLPRSKASFRGRTKSMPGNLRKLKLKAASHERSVSSNMLRAALSIATTKGIPESEGNFDDKDLENNCCENSPDLQSKVDRIQLTLMRLGPNFQAGEA